MAMSNSTSDETPDFLGKGSGPFDPRIAALEQRLADLEARSPASNVISPRFWTRAWAIFGHTLAVVILLQVIFFGGALLIGLLGFLGEVFL